MGQRVSIEQQMVSHNVIGVFSGVVMRFCALATVSLIVLIYATISVGQVVTGQEPELKESGMYTKTLRATRTQKQLSWRRLLDYKGWVKGWDRSRKFAKMLSQTTTQQLNCLTWTCKLWELSILQKI